MTKILRGYIKDKNGNLILIGTMPVPFNKDKCPPLLAEKRDIWSDKEQRSLRKKRFTSRVCQSVRLAVHFRGRHAQVGCQDCSNS